MTEYLIALQIAISFLDQADSNEVIYFLDHLNSNYCRYCGEKTKPSQECECRDTLNIKLCDEDRDLFLESLDNPSKPNDYLKKAFKAYFHEKTHHNDPESESP